MLIGKAGPATTSISTADAVDVTVRGRSLTADLMGRLSFTEYFYLLLTGRAPDAQQTFFLDLLLVASARIKAAHRQRRREREGRGRRFWNLSRISSSVQVLPDRRIDLGTAPFLMGGFPARRGE